MNDSTPATTPLAPTLGRPQYRGGGFDTSVDDFPWITDIPVFKSGWLLLGEAPDGPAVLVVHLGPGIPEDRPHHHNSAQVRVFVEGTLRIGKHWYGPGDIRIQLPGMTYGPELVGPNGCKQLLYFADRRGIYPHYKRDGGPQLARLAGLLRRAGIEPN